MTVKQIAESVGKEERTIQRWVKKAADKMSSVNDKMSSSSPMKPADYNLDETCEIIKAGMGANAAGIFRANAEKQYNSIPTSNALDEAFKAAIINLNNMASNFDSRITRIEMQQEERKALLPPPGKTKRAELSEMVRKMASQLFNSDFRSAWRELYKELYYRSHINVTTRAKNDGVKPLDIIERENLVDPAISICVELLSGGAV